MIPLQVLGSDGGSAQLGQPSQRPTVQIPDRSAENINVAQQTMAQAQQTMSQAIGLTAETYANSALAAARVGASRVDTFNGIVGAIGQGVELYNKIQEERRTRLEATQAAELTRQVTTQVTQLKDQFGALVASGMSEIEARNLIRDGYIRLREELGAYSQQARVGSPYFNALQESFQIVSTEADNVLQARNQVQLSQYEDMREAALGVYQEQMSALVNPSIVRLASIYTNPEEVRTTLNSIDSMVSSFSRDRGLTPIEALTLQRSFYQAANTYLTDRNIRIAEVDTRNATITEVFGLVNEAYDNYYDPSNSDTYQQGRVLEATLATIKNQYPDIDLGGLIQARSPMFEREQLIENLRTAQTLEELMARPQSESLLALSADAYDYLAYSYAFAYAFPGALQTDFSVAQVQAMGRDGDNPVVQGWVELGNDLRTARNQYTEIRNQELELTAELARREASIGRLLDQYDPQRRGQYTTLNQQLNYIINAPEAAGVRERGQISEETLNLYRSWYQEDLNARIGILRNNAINLQSEWLPYGIDLGDPAGSARRLTDWGSRTEQERNRARETANQPRIPELGPNSVPLVPQGPPVPGGAPSFLQGQ